jgi:hypothetical protein
MRVNRAVLRAIFAVIGSGGGKSQAIVSFPQEPKALVFKALTSTEEL